MVAAYTSLPVIGLPIKPSIGDGMDSVLSILNMPNGVPVATVSVNKAQNAALLATRIIASTDRRLQQRYEEYMRESGEEVVEKDRRLQELGSQQYLEAKKR
jgi:phosphoribosylaminoimidazole carboxylase PurE protein